jgi:hypothetical protein
MIPVEKFLHSLRGTVLGYDKGYVEKIYTHIVSNAPSISLDDVLARINSKDYPEISDGFQQFASIYSLQGQQFSKTEFFEIFSDMYATNPLLYKDAIKSIWNF